MTKQLISKFDTTLIAKFSAVQGALAAFLMALSLMLAGCGPSAESTVAVPLDKKPSPPAAFKVYAWEDYLTPAVIADAEKELNIKVELKVIESNEQMIDEIKKGDRYHLVTPSDYAVNVMQRSGYLTILDHKLIPNLKNVSRRFRNAAYDREARYSIPLYWGVTGLGYDKKIFPTPPDSWKFFFDPQFRTPYSGKISALGDARETIGAALLYLGLNPNSDQAEDHAKAKALILSLKKDLLNSQFESVDYEDNLAAGKVVLAQGWTTDFSTPLAENPQLQFTLPKEGFLLFIDNMAVPSSTPDRELSLRFIDYLLRPEVAAKLCNENGAATCNAAALSLVDEKVRNGVGYYLPEDAKFHVIKDVGEKGTELFNATWAEIETAQ